MPTVSRVKPPEGSKCVKCKKDLTNKAIRKRVYQEERNKQGEVDKRKLLMVAYYCEDCYKRI